MAHTTTNLDIESDNEIPSSLAGGEPSTAQSSGARGQLTSYSAAAGQRTAVGESASDQAEFHQPPEPTFLKRNFFALVGYQVLMRIGWIFKTESIIMPAVMDSLCGPGTALASWFRSWLPQLNRLGQSVPQLLVANRFSFIARKKIVVGSCSLLMGLSFLLLAALWHLNAGSNNQFLRIGFLAIYGFFFVCFGINNLGFNTVQGKLVRYNYRGRLFLLANSVGGGSAILAASCLLTGWLRQGNAGIVSMFVFAGCCFLLAGIIVFLCREHSERNTNGQNRTRIRDQLFLPLRLFRQDRQFRSLALIAAFFGSSMALFPHYLALYRETLSTSDQPFAISEVLGWVIIQTVGTIVISWCAGPAADRLGNRLVLQVILLIVACGPLVAIAISSSQEFARNWYYIVFVLVGVTPVTVRILNNFALEMSNAESHPHILGSLSICITIPVIFASQIVGSLIPLLGFYPLFTTVSGLVLVGWVLTFFVEEPRETRSIPVAKDVPLQ